MDKSKAIVSRAALERVLARAAELQSASGEESEAADSLTEGQVEELGKEVGLSPAHIRQALAEERARIEPITMSGSGLGYQLFGADQVGAQRVVRGKPARVLTTLDRWMQREGLRVVRQRADFIIWEPARGVISSVRRMLGGRDDSLFRANEISATVIAVDDEFSLVRLQASFASLRGSMGTRTALGTVIGSAGTGAAILMGVVVPVAVAPAILVTAVSYYSARRTQRYAIERASLALEMVLDRLERGDTEPPSLLKLIESALPPSR
jgi:hypothetical protein